MAIASAAGVARLTGRLPGGMTTDRGQEIHDFVRARGLSSCLELGTANGVGALYIGSALEANGFGTLTSVDKRQSAQSRRPLARDLVHEAGLSGRVALVHEETSYTWFLHDTLRGQLKADGEVEPKYDFVYIDGAHTWDVDALAFALTDRLLVPGGWILFDDLDWVLDARWPNVPEHQRSLAQVREVWELLVLTHPRYDEFHSDGQWAWARKSASEQPPSRLLVKRELVGTAVSMLRLARNRLRAHRSTGASDAPAARSDRESR